MTPKEMELRNKLAIVCAGLSADEAERIFSQAEKLTEATLKMSVAYPFRQENVLAAMEHAVQALVRLEPLMMASQTEPSGKM